jgi:glucosamine--fructose-6-phosphate aminotransferase (isomerizing)
MGSSYFAPLAFKYMGVAIYPEIASEYFYYLKEHNKTGEAVILSQSGKSSEALWCSGIVERYTAITNDAQSPLAVNAKMVIDIKAGREDYSSSKTYVNTLLALFKGFGMDTSKVVENLLNSIGAYEQMGNEIARKIFDLLQKKRVNGFYITGSGPNIATAMEAALILSEMTKIGFQGLPLAQYDHGPKETAAHSIVIQIVSKGNAYKRNAQVRQSIEDAGATVFAIEEVLADEFSSILYNIIPFNFIGYYLANLLQVKDTFAVGNKVTEVE